MVHDYICKVPYRTEKVPHRSSICHNLHRSLYEPFVLLLVNLNTSDFGNVDRNDQPSQMNM
jgi:hypothetical protein